MNLELEHTKQCLEESNSRVLVERCPEDIQTINSQVPGGKGRIYSQVPGWGGKDLFSGTRGGGEDFLSSTRGGRIYYQVPGGGDDLEEGS